MPNITDSRLLQEIVTTEQSYKASLDKLINILNGAVFGETVTALTTRLQSLQRVSKETITNLEETITELKKEEPDLVNRMLLAQERKVLLNTFFAQCTEYLPVFQEVQSLLKVSESDSGLRRVSAQVSEETRGLSLDAIIITPVQRAMRYELLLKELLKDKSLDKTQRTIIQGLYDTAKELNERFNEVQVTIDREIQEKAKEIKGYEFGDITSGSYTFGSISKRLMYTFWGAPDPKKDDTLIFELLDDKPESTDDNVKSLSND